MKKAEVFRKGSICLASLVFLLWAGFAFAQSELIDFDEVGQITGAISTSGLPLVVSAPLQLKVLVDQTICGTGAVQCTGNDHSTKTAAKTNHNPVRVIVQALDDNKIPVTGLASASITVSTPFVPAGGPGLARLVCGPDCFQEASDGIYAIYVHPAATGVKWKPGSYCLEVTVTVGAISVSDVVLIAIPF